ncbi:hypothetical protein SCANM63S_00637 [Streptomyces canarius]
MSLSSAGRGAVCASTAAADLGKSGIGSSLNRIDGQITPTYPSRAFGASLGTGAKKRRYSAVAPERSLFQPCEKTIRSRTPWSVTCASSRSRSGPSASPSASKVSSQ